MTPMPEPFVETYDALKKWLSKWAGVFWITLILATMLGFKLTGPGADIEELKVRLDSAEAARKDMQKQHDLLQDQYGRMERWMCVKSTPKEIALSGLKCDGLNFR
jgi:hypothetical protein